MDTSYIRMFSFYLPEGSSPQDYEEAVFERLSQFIEYAASHDIVLLHENEKGIYGEKAAQCKKLMDRFYGPNFKCIFDFANFIQTGEDTLKAYELLKPYIAYIHVKDARLEDGRVVPAGMGDGKLPEILADLARRDFRGYLSLEPHLYNFSGLAELEKGGHRTNVEAKPLSSYESFALAHSSLQSILKNL